MHPLSPAALLASSQVVVESTCNLNLVGKSLRLVFTQIINSFIGVKKDFDQNIDGKFNKKDKKMDRCRKSL